MPLYSYRCENEQCGLIEEHVNKWADRDVTYTCPSCESEMHLLGVTMPSKLSGKEGYQMKAVLANGQHVKGHFGKSAKRRRRGA